MPNNNLTQEYLKSILHYSPDTGIFTWLKCNSSSRRLNDKAGQKCRYIRIGINGTRYLAHRLAWLYVTGKWPNQIDHINHDKYDNRISNLRNVDGSKNQRNRSINKNNTSGIIGVFWRERNKVWVSFITLKGKNHHLGHFRDRFEAICARKSAEAKNNFHENHGSS